MAEQVRVGSCPNDNRVMATGTAIWGQQRRGGLLLPEAHAGSDPEPFVTLPG